MVRAWPGRNALMPKRRAPTSTQRVCALLQADSSSTVRPAARACPTRLRPRRRAPRRKLGPRLPRPPHRRHVVLEAGRPFLEPCEVAVGQLAIEREHLFACALDEVAPDTVSHSARTRVEHDPHRVRLVEAKLDEVVPGTKRSQMRHVETAIDDGVFWTSDGGSAVQAFEVSPGSPADLAGVRKGDTLWAIDNIPVESAADVARTLQGLPAGGAVTYAVSRGAVEDLISVRLALAPGPPYGLYYPLAAVGIFALLVGASVRLRRPNDTATLHFFWLTVAFFGVCAFTTTGEYTGTDRFFYCCLLYTSPSPRD